MRDELIDVILSCNAEVGTTDQVVDIEVAVLRPGNPAVIFLSLNLNARATFRWVAAPGQEVILNKNDKLMVDARIKGQKLQVKLDQHVFPPNHITLSATIGGIDSIYRAVVLEATSP